MKSNWTLGALLVFAFATGGCGTFLAPAHLYPGDKLPTERLAYVELDKRGAGYVDSGWSIDLVKVDDKEPPGISGFSGTTSFYVPPGEHTLYMATSGDYTSRQHSEAYSAKVKLTITVEAGKKYKIVGEWRGGEPRFTITEKR
jgi:hypothetical protein